MATASVSIIKSWRAIPRKCVSGLFQSVLFRGAGEGAAAMTVMTAMTGMTTMITKTTVRIVQNEK